MNITLIVPELSSGGAERVVVLLAQGLTQRGHRITVVTISSEDRDFYKLPTTVHRVALNLQQKAPTLLIKARDMLVRIVRLRQAVNATQPDLVISFLASMNIFSGIALFGTPYPKIGTEHNSPKIDPCAQPWESIRRFAYPHLTKIVSVSQAVSQDVDYLPEARKAVIYNPFIAIAPSTSPLQLPAGVDPTKKWIISMGRLTPQKGFDLLLKAFEPLAQRYPDWQLLVLGEGYLKPELEQLRDQLGLSHQVVFTGAISPPFPLLQNSELFVMASRFEGFPMAHGEALACGLPVLATNCCGVKELLRDGIDSVLVPNEDIAALTQAMDRLMSDTTERQRLASHAPEVLERFSLETILDQWEWLIDQVLKERSFLPSSNKEAVL